MKKFTLLLVFFYVVISLATSYSSWEVIFHGKPSTKSRFYVLNNWDKEGGVYNGKESTPFPADQVSDIMLKTMGILRDGVTWPGVRLGNLFRRPRATALFLINGISDSLTISSLSDQSYPVEQLLLNGVPSDDKQIMFGDDSVLSHFQKIFEGRSLSINSDDVKYNGDYKDKLLPDGVFNLQSSIDKSFVEELLSIKELVQQLSLSSVIDSSPDVFLFSFKSLSSLQKKYSPGSKQLETAVEMLSNVVKEVTKQLKEIYSDDIIIQALVLQWQYPELDGEKTNGIRTILKNFFTSDETKDIVAGLPLLVVPQMPNDERASLCDSLSFFINTEGGKLESDCPNRKSSNRILKRNAEINVIDDGDNSTTYSYGNLMGVVEDRSEDFPAIFMIIFATMVPLILALFAISWGMWNMDPGRDTVIYRNTDPVGIKLE